MALKILKWFWIVLGGLIGVIVIAAAVLYFIGSSKVNKTYDVQVAAVTVPTDEEAIERGRHFVEAIGMCQECHGENLGGEAEDDPMFATLTAGGSTASTRCKTGKR